MPCDEGGLAACPYTKSHGVSPGSIRLTQDDLLALEIQQSCTSLGREMAMALLDVELTPDQADGLRLRLQCLAAFEAWKQQKGKTRGF